MTVILSVASRSFIARGAVEGPAVVLLLLPQQLPAGAPGPAFGTWDSCTMWMPTLMTRSAVCETNTRFSRSRFTGKERDTESGNDYFGARYYASSMGRMMSPDPGNIGANPANPQTWNMYSYGLNNPLRMTDPTGMYVCEDSLDCKSENDQKFAKNLADAQTAANKLTGDDQAKAQRAIDAYGAQGVDNGVNGRFDSNVQGGVTEVSGVAGEKSADNSNGQNINVTFNSGDASAGLVAHEGSHVADASAWVSSGFSQGMDPTHGQTELNAYHVQFNIMNAQHPVLMDFSGQPFSLGSAKGRASWIQGTTFKMILPDMLQMIKNNYSDLDKPAFTKGEAVQP